MANQSYVYGSGVTNIEGVDSFEIGNSYSKFDIVFFSGYTESSPAGTPRTAVSLGSTTGHYYYTGESKSTSTAANSPAGASTVWSQKLFFEPSYGASVEYKNDAYGITFGDGYYNIQNKSENSLKTVFTLPFRDRSDKETRALVHFFEDSFNKGEKPSGSYTGIYFTPFAPYNAEHEFYTEKTTRNFSYPNVNSVSTSLYREDQSTINWQEYFIPFNQTSGFFEIGRSYSKHDIVYLSGDTTNDDGISITNGLYKPNQSGWYYYTGDDSSTSTALNGPVGNDTLWTKDNFYFELNKGLSIESSPRYLKAEVQNGYMTRTKDGINNKLLNFNFTLEARDDKEAKAIVHFLEHKVGSKQFSFTPPAPYNKSNLAFFCPDWKHTLNFKDNNSIELTFIETPVNLLNDVVSFSNLITIDPYFKGKNQTQY